MADIVAARLASFCYHTVLALETIASAADSGTRLCAALSASGHSQ